MYKRQHYWIHLYNNANNDRYIRPSTLPPVYRWCQLFSDHLLHRLTPQEYIDIKTEFAKETKLGEGTGTCFGSLVWCCKPSKPCPLRDITLKNIGMTHDEYLDLKKELSDKLVGVDKPTPDESVKVLAETFNIGEMEAMSVLNDCNNDLRMAVKLLRVKSLGNAD